MILRSNLSCISLEKGRRGTSASHYCYIAGHLAFVRYEPSSCPRPCPASPRVRSRGFSTSPSRERRG